MICMAFSVYHFLTVCPGSEAASTIGFEKVWDCNINGLPVPPEGIGEPELPQIEFPELPQTEFLNLADQPSRKSNRKHRKPERFGHNIYD